MATSINSSQIRDGQVSRADLNTNTIGQSVISKIVQGTYMSITSTGSDSGTGDVTLNVNVPLATTTVAGLLSPADKTTLSNFAGAGYAPLNSPSFTGYPVANLSILTAGNTSLAQIIQNPASFANDTGSFATSVIILTLPNSYVVLNNTQMSIEVSGKDVATGFFKLLITAKLTNDGGTATSWGLVSATMIGGNAPFTAISFAMSIAAPKLPMIILGDGTTGLSFPAYTIDKVTILGPTANTLYNSGSVMTMSMLAQASAATTYVVQTIIPLGMMAKLDSTSVQTFNSSIDNIRGYSARGNYIINPYSGATPPPYSAGLAGENFGNGLLVDFGANFDQLSYSSSPVINASVPTMFGAYFRIDTRDAQATEMFSISSIPTGTGTTGSREQKVFRVTRTGDIFSTTNSYQVLTTNSTLSVAKLSATGTPSITTYLRGDNTWATITGGGDMLKSAYDTTASGTSVDNARALGGVAAASYAVVSSINSFVAGQTFASNILVSNTATLLAAPQTSGVLQNAVNILYYSNGTINIPISTVVPAGGTAGQVLQKTTATNYDTSWVTIAGGNVTGPATSAALGIATFNNATGTLLSAPMLSVTATGALQTTGVGSGTIVGNARGVGAIDLQISRTVASMVASGASSVITGGINNTNIGVNSYIGGGSNNIITAANASIVISGGNNNSATPSYAFIGGGTSNVITGGLNAVISGGTTNTIGTGADSSVISGGSTNLVVASATFAVVAGGFTNKINNALALYSAIGGGQNNTIVAPNSFIGGGTTNAINATGASASVIAGGSSNTISATSTNQTIIGGGSNLISATQSYNSITGGFSHTISGATGTATINGGNGNQITQGTGGVIIGGSLNISTANYTLVSGFNASATIYGQRVFSNNKFTTVGDAQMTMYNLMAATASTTAVVMTLDGLATVTVANSLTIAPAQSKYLFINVTAQSTLAATVTGIAIWEIKVLIARTVGVATTVIIGTPANVLLASAGTITGWAVAIAADTTLGALRLTVTTGAATTAVKWLATVEGTELTF